jgi:hypothetical protein
MANSVFIAALIASTDARVKRDQLWFARNTTARKY